MKNPQRLLQAAEAAQVRLVKLGQALGESTPPDMVDEMNELEAAIEENGGRVVTLRELLEQPTNLDAF